MDPLVVALLVASALAAVAFAGDAVTSIVVATRRPRPSFARLRRDLRAALVDGIEPGDLEGFEARLADADRWRARRAPLEVVPRVAILLIVLGVVAWATAAGADLRIAAPIALVAVVAFVVSMRAGAVRRARFDAVLAVQRAEVLDLLERARIPQRRRVPGLRDRVTRALAILREQQK